MFLYRISKVVKEILSKHDWNEVTNISTNNSRYNRPICELNRGYSENISISNSNR